MKSGFHISAGLSSVTDHISSENTKRTDDIEFRPEQLKQLLDFLSVFLIHYRKTLVTEKTLFEQATLRAYDFTVSSEGNDDIRLPKTSTLNSNSCYQNLNKEFGFTSDEYLKKLKLDKRVGPMQREIELNHCS